MRKIRVLALAAILALVSGVLVGYFTASPAGALSTAKLQVTHRTIYGYNVAVDDGYTVEYRFYDRDAGAWQDWEDAVDKTNTGESVASCSPYGTYRWEYETDPFNATQYTAVEWRIEMTQGYDGTQCSSSAHRDYCQTETLNEIVSPGNTGSIMAGCYY